MSNQRQMVKARIFLLVLSAMLIASCTKPVNYADMVVSVGYSINEENLVTDSLCFTNEAGNEFMVTEIQWFLSNLELQTDQGGWIALDHRDSSYANDKVFYIDTNIPESQTLEIFPIPVGNYKKLRFTFGLDEQDNQTGLFSDSPEADMFWPDVMGGGYHYMKLNGKYKNMDGRLAPLAIHLGIGQNEQLTEFYQNCFIVELPIDFNVSVNSDNQIDLTMIVDNWFRNPNTIDFNEYGSSIMQNQIAQLLLKSNGHDVFRVENQVEKGNNVTKENLDSIAMKFSTVMKKAAPKPHYWSWKNVKERIESVMSNDSKI